MIVNIITIIVALFFLAGGIFGTLFINGKIPTDIEPNKWAYINTVTFYLGFIILILELIFIK